MKSGARILALRSPSNRPERARCFSQPFKAFVHHFNAQHNDRIAVYCDMGSDVGDVLRVLYQCGLKEFEDFTTLDTVDSEMWRCAKPEMRK